MAIMNLCIATLVLTDRTGIEHTLTPPFCVRMKHRLLEITWETTNDVIITECNTFRMMYDNTCLQHCPTEAKPSIIGNSGGVPTPYSLQIIYMYMYLAKLNIQSAR